MKSPLLRSLALVLVPLCTAIQANEGYDGYLLHQHGDPPSATYQTANTLKNNNTLPLAAPDVYLNPLVATLGKGVGNVVGNATGAIGKSNIIPGAAK
ncbi:hypothetical protein PG994_009514 [Apiospora phragmitis]|uniref:Uncharacterized protein n=1 Tax=Apiospora phragmitis TaxID=2905665 RepID=A0ABR1U6B5_9PEZI